MRPSVVGYWTSAPQKSSDGSNFAGLPTTTVIPSHFARISTTAIVCGWQSSATKNFCRVSPVIPWHMVIASAAAVPSSSSDAPASGRPVSSEIMVWKLRSASRRPCATSAWYGV